MRTNSTLPIKLSLSALAVSLFAGCALDQNASPDDGFDGLEETAQETVGSTGSVTPLPSFSGTPNIKTAMAALKNPTTVAVVRTIAGFQIYRCEQGTAAPEWKLRTPLAGLEPSPDVQKPSTNRARLDKLVGSYHYRSDFGGLLSTAQLTALGLASPPVNAPVWDFTFSAGTELRHEVLAARLLAQDVTNPANVPLFLLEVRGRSIDPGTPRVLATATHALRWNTRGGLAPAAATCTATTLGREVQSPYSAEYHYLSTTP